MSNRRYAGMTVYERLFLSELLPSYDTAVKKRHVRKVISILKEVELPIENIIPILKFEGLPIDALPSDIS
jgi:hypothetical protein